MAVPSAQPMAPMTGTDGALRSTQSPAPMIVKWPKLEDGGMLATKFPKGA
jgi:hypothetical protein